MAKEVISEIIKYSCGTDAFYYCPHCNTCLWDSIYFIYPMHSRCPICKKRIKWKGLKYYRKIKAYAINGSVVERYLQSIKTESEGMKWKTLR